MYLCLASNALAVAFGTVLGYLLADDEGKAPFVLTGEVGEGIPQLDLPPFSTTYNNTTYEFLDMVEIYGSSLAFIPLVALLESVAIAKAFCTLPIVLIFPKLNDYYYSKRKECRCYTRNDIAGSEQYLRVFPQVYACNWLFYKNCC